jgi:hypothetical protein
MPCRHSRALRPLILPLTLGSPTACSTQFSQVPFFAVRFFPMRNHGRWLRPNQQTQGADEEDILPSRKDLIEVFTSDPFAGLRRTVATGMAEL